MKTLIIHPKDKTTTFLSHLYSQIENKTVITGGTSKPEIKELIRTHDRVMMMGHGCPFGLFNTREAGITNEYGIRSYMAIDETMVNELKNNPENVYIWCNADEFVNQFPVLQGFYTGMFISEVHEARYMNVYPVNQDVVNESNFTFVDIFKKYANESTNIIYENVMTEYGEIAEVNNVAEYNFNRLYLNRKLLVENEK